MLWPYHAALMATAFTLSATGAAVSTFMRKKPWWFKTHRRLEIAGAAFLVLGYAMAAYMIWRMGADPERPHQMIGGAAVLVVLATAAAGWASLKVRRYGARLRTAHRWAGRLSLVLMLTAALTGMMDAGLI